MAAQAAEFRRYLATRAIPSIPARSGVSPLLRQLLLDSRVREVFGHLFAGLEDSSPTAWVQFHEHYIEAFGETPPPHVWGIAEIGSDGWWSERLGEITSAKGPSQGLITNFLDEYHQLTNDNYEIKPPIPDTGPTTSGTTRR